MKKIIAVMALLFSLPAFADKIIVRPHPHKPWHMPGHKHHHHGWWVVPTIVGGVVVYEIVRNNQQVVVTCSEWKEIQTPDGKIYRERTCSEEIK